MENIFDIFKKIEKEKASSASEPISYIVAGLGNPGDKYHFNHHNIGFLALDCIEQKLGIKLDRSKFRSLCADTAVAGKRVLFMRPQTFMNLSGEAVAEAARFYKIPAENIIIIHDDIALPPGKMRIRTKGSDGGQKGIRNIIQQLGTEEFTRIRIGAGSPPPQISIIDWVLMDIAKEDREAVFECLMNVLPALELIISDSPEKAMSRFN